MHLKNQSQKSAVIRLLSGFPVLLAFLTAHVRTNPRNLLTCGYAVFVTIDERNTAIMNPAGQPKARQTQCAVIGYRVEVRRCVAGMPPVCMPSSNSAHRLGAA